MKKFFTLFTVCLFLSIKLFSHNFDPSTVYLVDTCEKNYLFRGGLPLLNSSTDHGSFAYDELMATFNSILEETFQTTLPEDTELYVISVLSNESERKEIKIEKNFFRDNPDAGKFYLYPIHGSWRNPNRCTQKTRQELIDDNSQPSANLKAVTVDLWSDFLSPQSIRPRVVYFHCYDGFNRTGEVAGSYLMRYSKESFDSVDQQNEEIAGEPINVNSENDMKWYGYYLIYDEDYTTVGAID